MNPVLKDDEILKVGLELLHSTDRINNVKADDPWVSKTNQQHFKDHCGSGHIVAAQIWMNTDAAEFVPDGLTHKKSPAWNHFWKHSTSFAATSGSVNAKLCVTNHPRHQGSGAGTACV